MGALPKKGSEPKIFLGAQAERAEKSGARGHSDPSSSGGVRCCNSCLIMRDRHVGMLDPETCILESFQRLNPGLDEQEAGAASARFAFRNRDALQRISHCRGESAFVSDWHAHWLLLLDKPAHPLDIESVALLEGALREFDGALLVVSHDQAFL